MKNQKNARLKELKLRIAYHAQHEEKRDRNENGRMRNGNNQVNNVKYVKTPAFKEDRDCLDAHLLRFDLCEVPEDPWAITLVRS